jgi:hypothetical protein
MSVVDVPTRDRIVAELDALLRRVWSAHPPQALHPGDRLRDLGLRSGQQIDFLSRIEAQFAIDWDDVDPPIGALSTLGGIADLVIALRSPDSSPPRISLHGPEENQS